MNRNDFLFDYILSRYRKKGNEVKDYVDNVREEDETLDYLLNSLWNKYKDELVNNFERVQERNYSDGEGFIQAKEDLDRRVEFMFKSFIKSNFVR